MQLRHHMARGFSPFRTRSPLSGIGGAAIPDNAIVIDNATAPAADGEAIVLNNATADEGAFIIIDNAT